MIVYNISIEKESGYLFMTVKELIEKLKNFDGDAMVLIKTQDIEKGQIFVDVDVQENDVVKLTKEFYDAFDHTRYRTNVLKAVENNDYRNSKKIVEIYKKY